MSDSRVGLTTTAGSAQVQPPKNWLEQAAAAPSNAVGARSRVVGGAKANANTPAGTVKKVDVADTRAVNNKGFDPGKLLGDLTSIGLPDSIVVTSDKMRAQSNVKNFALLNPVSLKGTHLINHTQPGKVIGGVKFTQVEAMHFSADGKGTRREDGVGYVRPFGDPKNSSTFFVNVRGGDTNPHGSSVNGMSVNVGFFGPVARLKPLLDKIPSNSKTHGIKQGLINGLDKATAAGGQAGFAWSGNLLRDSKTKQWTLNVGGVKMPLGDLTEAPNGNAGAVMNYAKKPIARSNNEEAYLRGANPFARADETRSSSGVPLNHADLVASIAGDIRSLQARVEGKDASPVRTNADAARVLDRAIGLTESVSPREAQKWRHVEGSSDMSVRGDALSSGERVKLNETLKKLAKAGTYFGSDTVKAAAQEATKSLGAKARADGGDAEAQSFARDVFAGKFRGQATRQPNIVDGMRDAGLGLSRWAAPISTLISDDGTMAPDNGNPAIALQRKAKGFTDRVAKDGGALKTLGLKVSTSMSAKVAEAKASAALNEAVRLRVVFHSQKPDTAENRYQTFKSMSPTERRVVAKQVQEALLKP
jgi:hypothetical protein